MATLDTRGFMDGALRGFEVMDNYYNHQHSLRQADERLAMEKENHKQSQKQSEQSLRLADERAAREQVKFEADYGTKGEDGKYTGGRLANQAEQKKKEFDLEKKKTNAALALSQAQTDEAKARVARQKRLDKREEDKRFKTQNKPFIDSAWDKLGRGETLTEKETEVLNDPRIKGTSFDPYSYSPDKANKIKTAHIQLGEVIDGKRDKNDSDFLDNMSVVWENELKKSVGQTATNGKVIAGNKLARVDFIADIDPNMDGEQPGIVLGVVSTYEDGSQSERPVPITQNRTTEQSDNVKVIPLKDAMNSVQEQYKRVLGAELIKRRKSVLGETPAEKHKREAQVQNQKLVTDLIKTTEKQRTEALAMTSPDQMKEVNQYYDQRIAAIRNQYGGGAGRPGKLTSEQMEVAKKSWVGSGKDAGRRRAFIDAYLKKGGTLTEEGLAILNRNYVPVHKQWLKEQEEERNAAVVSAIKNGTHTVGVR